MKVGVWDERLLGEKAVVIHGAGDSVGGGGGNVGYGLGGEELWD